MRIEKDGEIFYPISQERLDYLLNKIEVCKSAVVLWSNNCLSGDEFDRILKRTLEFIRVGLWNTSCEVEEESKE